MFKDQPIKRKLVTVILLTSSAVLLLACGTFFVYELLTFRQTMVRNLSTVAQVVATNSTAALAFDNRTDATEVLAALSAERHIVAAGLYDKTGALFARYPATAPDDRLPARLELDGHQFARAHLILQKPVVHSNRRLGTLVLKSDLDAMVQRLSLYGALTALAIVLSSLAAIPLANRLQRHISRPVQALAGAAKTVSERKDYSVRAARFGDDELGRLADAFNDMLAQIQERDAALRQREEELRREVAERQLAEENVRENQERLGLALEAAQIGHWELDLVTGAARRSPRHDQIFGYSELLPEWSYEVFLKHVHPEDRARVDESFQSGVASGDWDFECRILRADQAERWIWARGHVFRNSLQQQVRMLGLVADITERKEAEEEIRRLNTDLERRVEERTAELESFSYSVSHDLRAPLRHVHGYAEMLQQATEGQLSEKAQRYLKIITEATVEMGELIDDLLAFSQVGRTEMRETQVRLDELVQETIRGLELATNGRNIIWETESLPAVVGDRSLLKQVLANLVGNAVKYSRRRDPARIEIGCGGAEDGRLILFVRDNGAGFDMQYAHKLFDVFQRLHRAEDFEGTGIGLASVRRIVARHGGRVWAEAAVNEGATFYFTLKPSQPTGADDQRSIS